MPGIFPTAGEVVEFEILTAISNQVGQNMVHFGVQTTTSGGASLQEIANAYDLRVATPYKSVMSTNATYRGVGATNLATPRSRQYFSITFAGPGTYGADLIPTQVRGLLSWYADAGGKAQRGRTYLPFPARSAADPTGIPTGAYLTAANAVRDAISPAITVVGAGGSTTMRMIIYHRPPTILGQSVVVFAFTRTRFATQRKSGAYGRTNSPHF